MASWVLVPCGEQLRAELNTIAPNRDKSSDGTIGDTAHQQHVSDHNDDEVGKVPIRDADSKHEVHAYDADKDLRESDLTMEKVVQHILSRCRSGQENRLRYVIYNRRIWEASNGWRQSAYSGDNAHTEHAHFSFSYTTSLEADRRSWRLEDIPVALTAADKNWISQEVAEAADKGAKAAVAAILRDLPKAVLDTKIGDGTNPARTVRNTLIDNAGLRGYLVGADDAIQAGKPGGIPLDAPVVKQTEAARKALSE